MALNPLAADNQYTQPVTINGVNGNGNWKFVWTYEVGFANTVGGPYAPKTAWELQSSDSESANVAYRILRWSVDAVEVKRQRRLVVQGIAHDAGLARSITACRRNGRDHRCRRTTICTLPLVTNILSNHDFTYLGNAGRNGTLNNLFDNSIESNGTVNEIQGGVSTAINGKKDDHAGNDGTGGDRAVIDSVATGSCWISAEGSYTLSVTGTLKGVLGGVQPSGRRHFGRLRERGHLLGLSELALAIP